MSLIIAATDFSEASKNAVKYACDLALSQNADVLVMHSYSFPVIFSDLPIPEPIDDVRASAEEGMGMLLTELTAAYPQLKISKYIVYGDIVDGIEEYISNNGMPMLVVAGNGYSPENTVWLDSTLIAAFRNVKCPVLAIPMETEYAPVRKICFAYDNKYPGSEAALEHLKTITELLNAELHVLYAQPDVHTQDNELDVNHDAKRILSSVDPLYHFYYEKDINSAVGDFVAANQIDWLAVIPRRHPFFESLFHKSHTKELVNHIRIPIMALHEN